MEENKSQVSARHRKEWLDFRTLFLEPLYGQDPNPELAKTAKGVADILKIYQEGERKAWGFADGEDNGPMEIAWEQ